VRIGTKLGGAIQDRAGWLAPLFLLLGVLAPTVCVLWFMNDAARTQAESARQRVTEAYRAQLWLIRDRIDGYWSGRAAALQAISGGSEAEFPRAVEGKDSVIFLDAGGAPMYPSPAFPPPGSPFTDRTDWLAAEALESGSEQLSKAAADYARIADAAADPSLAAQAAQAEIRCLARSGQKEAAIREIRKRFGAGPASRGMDASGRLIAADEQLLALRLIRPGDRGYQQAAWELAKLVNDYSVAMPSAQRLFLMDELGAPSPEAGPFPTYAAERLAALFLDAEKPSLGAPALQATRLPGVWKYASPNGRVIALYRTERILGDLRNPLEQAAPRGVRFAMIPPGSPGAEGAIPAGPGMPGWRIGFTLLDTKAFDDAARGRMVSYLWAGFLVAGAMIVTGILAGQALRRQWRLAQLKTDLLAAVSHELKTPLASMRLLVDALLEENKFEPQKTRDYLELIAGENQRLSRLIGNFLTFSRIERNRQRFEFAETRPEDVVQGAVHAMRERLQAPACRLEIDVEEGLPALRADRDALVTVLLNLLDNAHKYTPRDRRIVVRAYREGGSVVFAVTDNGIGIAPREQKRIFRRFYQVDRRLARETGGCGLGLSIVDFIVRAHGGQVRVESKPGAGSTFRVVTPLGAEPKAAGA
jgi:signal transduction histidine kinase